MNQRPSRTSYVGQVERDPRGGLWAVLYRSGRLVTKEQVSTVRQGRRRATDLVLTAADTLAERPSRPAPAHLTRMVEATAPVPRHRRAPVAGIG